MAREIKIPFQVNFQYPVPLFFGHFPGDSIPVHSGVVYQDFQAPECFHGGFYDVFSVGKGCNITFYGQRFAAHCLNFYRGVPRGQVIAGDNGWQILCDEQVFDVKLPRCRPPGCATAAPGSDTRGIVQEFCLPC